MAKTVLDFQIIDNKQLTQDFFILELSAGVALPEILPGQFAQVRVDGSADTFLRRPFSVYDVNYEAASIRLLLQVAGKGTKALSLLRKGESLNLILPLGKPFSKPGEEERSLLIGGGVGIAPLLYLGKYLRSIDSDFEYLLGFRSRDRIIEYQEFSRIAKVHITTEDGSEGEKGFVTQHSVLSDTNYSRIYCCGPDPMMKAVGEFAKRKNIHCEVSLENLMGCGFGVCLCCVVKTTSGNLCSCIDGPVFNINDLKW
jgi:dihydroorotate dehydrogenase electron transfer subunit